MGSEATEEKIPRGRPAFAESQRARIFKLLREAGPAGISRAELIFQHHFTQCGARIFELQKMGFAVRSEVREGKRFVHYVLGSEPKQVKPFPSCKPKDRQDSCEQRATGLPLFDSAARS